MILKYVKLKNFRQFVGEQRIEFAGPGQQNVTIIYGANGAGKTTLLNAFTWALFDEFTPAFENQKALLNEQVRSETEIGGSTELSVEVCFEHDSRTYYVVRSKTTFRDKAGVYRDGATARTIDIQGPNGPPERPSESAANVVAQILPSGLHQFFFFDGERIEGLVRPDHGSQDLDQAIKTILGLEVLEQVYKSMPSAAKKLRDSLKQYDKGVTEDLRAAIERGDRDLVELQESLVQSRANRNANQEQRTKVEALLRDNAAARERQLRLDDLRKQASSLEEKLVAFRRDSRLALSDRAFLAFAEPLANRAIKSVEELREKGRLPAAYERQFLEDLLARHLCLCGTSLEEGTPGHDSIAKLLPVAGIRDLQEAWSQIGANAKRYLAERPSIRERLRSNVDAIANSESELGRVLQDIGGIEEQQRKSGTSIVADYASQRDVFDRKIRDLDIKIHMDDNSESAKQKVLADLSSKLQKAEIDDDRGKILQRQLSAADRISDAVARILQIRRDQTREQLDLRIKQTYEQIAFKAYVPELTTDFNLILTKKVGSSEDVAVSKSQGENQLLALSFVGALARLARERFDDRANATKDSLSSFEGGIYPFVMDSPFGALDENYRREVAHAIPLLAPQVVVMVSKSQGLGVVQEQLYGRIGKSWVIAFETPKVGAAEEYLEIDGKAVPYIVQALGEFESARFLEML